MNDNSYMQRLLNSMSQVENNDEPTEDFQLEDTQEMEQDLGLQERPSVEESLSSEYKPSTKMVDMLKGFEGDKDYQGLKRKGAPEGSFRDGRFYPYGSIEGGSDTIGYGDKDTVSPEEMERYRSEGMSEEEADGRLKDNMVNYLGEASKNVGRPVQDFLPQNASDSLSSYLINTGAGTKQNPSLHKYLKQASDADLSGDESAKSDAVGRMIQEIDANKVNGEFNKGLESRRSKERSHALEGGQSIMSDEQRSQMSQEPLPEQYRGPASEEPQGMQRILQQLNQSPEMMSEELPYNEQQSIGEPAQLPPAEQPREPASIEVPEQAPTSVSAPQQPSFKDMIEAQTTRDTAISEQKRSFEDERVDALRRTNLISAGAEMLGGVMGMKSGQRVPVNVDTKALNKITEAEYKAKVSKQRTDPNSELSKVYQDFGKTMFPNQDSSLFAKVNAEQFEKLFPVIAKQAELQKKTAAVEKKIFAKEEAKIASEVRKESRAQSKADIKEEKQIQKENRGTRTEAKNSLSALDEQEKYIDSALDMLENQGASTGPIDQYIGKVTPSGQKLQKAINNISLEKMVKMFAGMSKAIDSDAERAFFASTQPSMSDYESVNIETLKKLKEGMESLRAKTQKVVNEFDTSGERMEDEAATERRPQPGEVVISNGKRYQVDADGDNLIEL